MDEFEKQARKIIGQARVGATFDVYDSLVVGIRDALHAAHEEGWREGMRHAAGQGFMMVRGRAYIKTANDTPMEMKPARERVIRALLVPKGEMK